MFTDTMFSHIASQRKNKCAQVFCDPSGWARLYPMKNKSDAHEALSLLFSDVGVPHTMISDGAKEQQLGAFRRKAREADCNLKAIEPHTQKSNAAEGSIRELKRGISRKMCKSRCPKVLWDHCAEMEGLIRSHTALNIFSLDGEVPETYVTGQTADISEIAEFEWYQWIYFRDTAMQLPESKEVLGRYLGPSRDVGPAMAAKILKGNGQVMVRSTFRALTPDEEISPTKIQAREEYTVMVNSKLGPDYKPEDFADDPDTLKPRYLNPMKTMKMKKRHPMLKHMISTLTRRSYSLEGTLWSRVYK